MKKTLSLILAILLLFSTMFVFVSCTPTQYKSISLTDENIEDYIKITLSYENFACQERYCDFGGTVYNWSANGIIKIKSKKSNYIFDDVTMNVKITTLNFSKTDLVIFLDENGNYEDTFYCSGTELLEPNAKEIRGIAKLTNISGFVRIPE